MYILMITNPQDETTKLFFDELSQCTDVIKQIDEANNTCLYRIFNDEFQAIKRSHNDTRLIDAIQE